MAPPLHRNEGKAPARLLLLCLAAVVLAVLPPRGSATEETSSAASRRIALPLGNIDGVSCDLYPEVTRYLGVPFAKPVTGSSRFRRPEMYDQPYPSPALQATVNPPPCGSYCAKVGDYIGTDFSSEDCLYLNLWVPSQAFLPGAKVPVRVYIHGGHDLDCCASDPFVDGCDYAAKMGAIQVNIQYRKGPFGLLAHPATWSESNTTGNWAILDQQLALEWVRDHIAFFGGDRNKVLLNGHSQGAQYVDLHMVAPGSWGLFSSAISQSPPCVRQLTLSQAYKVSSTLLELVGCANSSYPAAELECLRSLPWSTLYTATTDMVAAIGLEYAMCESVSWSPTFQVVVDGEVLPEHVVAAHQKGEFAQVPYMVGFSTNEGNFFVQSLTIEESTFDSLVDEIYPGVQSAPIRALYPIEKYSVLSSPLSAQLGDLWTDIFFKCPILERLQTRAGNAASSPSYLYQWDVTPTCPTDWQYMGAYHSVDLMPTLGIVTHINPPEGTCNFTEKEVIVSTHSITAWTSMAATGVPRWQNGMPWTQWHNQSQLGTFLNVDFTGTAVVDLHSRCAILQKARLSALGTTSDAAAA